ncbi:MAG: hypothetical protein ACM3O9_04915 [Methylocystaceae bacterium]
MKIYYLCDTCELVVGNEETDGEGMVFLRTVCDDCARELGIISDAGYGNFNSFYN